MKNKDWRERIKVNDGDWFGLSLFIDGDGVVDEYKAGGVLVSSAEEKLKNFIEEVREEAKEEVEKKFREKYKKRAEEMNVPYSEEDGQEFWQGYQEGYNQGLKDMVVDTYYLDAEFQTKLTTK